MLAIYCCVKPLWKAEHVKITIFSLKGCEGQGCEEGGNGLHIKFFFKVFLECSVKAAQGCGFWGSEWLGRIQNLPVRHGGCWQQRTGWEEAEAWKSFPCACFPKAGCKPTKTPPSSLPGERIYSLETAPEELTQQISLTDPYLPLAFPICRSWKLKGPVLGLTDFLQYTGLLLRCSTRHPITSVGASQLDIFCVHLPPQAALTSDPHLPPQAALTSDSGHTALFPVFCIHQVLLQLPSRPTFFLTPGLGHFYVTPWSCQFFFL